jgi:hypothetical protein
LQAPQGQNRLFHSLDLVDDVLAYLGSIGVADRFGGSLEGFDIRRIELDLVLPDQFSDNPVIHVFGDLGLRGSVLLLFPQWRSERRWKRIEFLLGHA